MIAKPANKPGRTRSGRPQKASISASPHCGTRDPSVNRPAVHARAKELRTALDEGGAAPVPSGLDHHLYEFSGIHRPITVGHAIEVHGPIEHAPGIDPALKYIG